MTYRRNRGHAPSPVRLIPNVHVGAALRLSGYRRCTLCDKELEAIEVSIRSHLRVHVRSGALDRDGVVETYLDIMYKRKEQQDG